MNKLLVSSHVIDALLPVLGYNVKLSDLDSVNATFENKTLLKMLMDMFFETFEERDDLSVKMDEIEITAETLRDNIIANINSLLLHREIDFTIRSNALVFAMAAITMFVEFIDNDQLDEILERNNLNLNKILSDNPIKQMIIRPHVDIASLIVLFKHGADTVSDIDTTN